MISSLPPTPNPAGSHTLTKPMARRMKRSVKRLEHQYNRQPTDMRARHTPATPFLTLQPALVLTTLGPGSLASPAATAQCQIYRDSQTGFGLVAAETGALSSTIGSTFPAGTSVSVLWRNGIWWIALSNGGTNPLYWARSPLTGINAAAGTWTGGLTGTSFTGTIETDIGGVLQSVGTGTVNWFYKDADAGGKLIPCVFNGTTYDAIGDSCTSV